MKQTGNTTTLYLFLFNKPGDGEITVPNISNSIIKTSVLNGVSLKSTIQNGNIIIDTKGIDANALIPVIELKVKGVVQNTNKKSGREMQSKELD